MKTKQKTKKKKLHLENWSESMYFCWCFQDDKKFLFRKNGHAMWLFEDFYLIQKKAFFKKYKRTMSKERFTSKI